jgi:outer membrane protein assembly factor BamD
MGEARFASWLKAGTALRGTAVAMLVAGVMLAGCAKSNDAAKLLNPDPPDKMYAEADGLLNKGSYSESAKKFEDLDRDHPYSPEARRAMVMASYAYYKAGKYPEAIASAQRYTTLHPGTKDAALAHHIIASANFDEIRDPMRDQTATRKALTELKTLRQRYPDSPYSRQAENRIRIAMDVLAANEMTVARYYQKQSNWVAAINRYKVVVTDYQTTAHVEEALYRLAEANMSLGIVTEAQSAAAVLGHNFPNSEWYQHAYALLKTGGVSPQMNQGSWISNALKPFMGQPKKAPQPAPSAPSPGMPSVDDMPAPRAPLPPASDIPTASTTPKPKPTLGFNSN